MGWLLLALGCAQVLTWMQMGNMTRTLEALDARLPRSPRPQRDCQLRWCRQLGPHTHGPPL
jgi:hypothetical protein